MAWETQRLPQPLSEKWGERCASPHIFLFPVHGRAMPISTTNELLFAALIGNAVALNTELGNGRWPQARHHLRLLAVRAAVAGHPQIRAAALELLGVLDAEIRPTAITWKTRLGHLNTAIDAVLDDVADPGSA